MLRTVWFLVPKTGIPQLWTILTIFCMFVTCFPSFNVSLNIRTIVNSTTLLTWAKQGWWYNVAWSGILLKDQLVVVTHTELLPWLHLRFPSFWHLPSRWAAGELLHFLYFHTFQMFSYITNDKTHTHTYFFSTGT